ncbi:MAG TPA: cytochrome c, partial [Solirubrobacteraceae bacterium]|nr:cytochrome c [Solirubrobacteraceae bacterium]
GGDDSNTGGEPEMPPEQVVAAGDAAKGREVFGASCAACHGADGGGGSGPKLAGEQAYTDPATVVNQVRNGGGGMPAFADSLDEQELADVSAFVVEELAP